MEKGVPGKSGGPSGPAFWCLLPFCLSTCSLFSSPPESGLSVALHRLDERDPRRPTGPEERSPVRERASGKKEGEGKGETAGIPSHLIIWSERDSLSNQLIS